MAAVFDFFLIRSSDDLRSSLVVSSNLENMGLAVGISLLLCIEAEIHVRDIRYFYFRLMAAIFDFSLIRTSDSLRSSLVVSPDLENMSIAVGISLISCIETELRLISFFLLPSWISDFGFIRQCFWWCHEKFTPENIGILLCFYHVG